MRIVSLVPSTTETLLAWGVDVVACTRFCEQPLLRHVGGTKDPDLEAIAALAPDLVVVDREENRREDADALTMAGLRLHVTHVRSLGDVQPTADALAAAVEVDASTSAPEVAFGDPTAPWATAFVPIWRRPWMTINDDTYGSSLLAHLGITNVFASSPDRYPVVEIDAVAARRPDLVLLPTEPYAFRPTHIAELHAQLPDATILTLDGQDLFWWGTRTPAAVERLRAALRAAPTPR